MTALAMSGLQDGFARLLTNDPSKRMTASEARDWLTATRLPVNISASIACAASVLRTQMQPVKAPQNAIDVCGTGGDGQHTLNISTATAIVAAACGVPVAKHGNRAASSRAGGADTLEALGLNLDNASARASETLEDIDIAFLFAQRHHAGLSWLGPIRKELQSPTVLNYVGPLCNPAQVTRQLVGVPNDTLFATFADMPWQEQLGMDRVMLVSGGSQRDGTCLDEIATFGVTKIGGHRLPHWVADEVSPAIAGIEDHPLTAIRGGDAAHNATELRRILTGDPQQNLAYRDAVLINTAGALIVAGEVDSWRSGVEEAREAIDKGLANTLLNCWIKYCE